MKVEGLNKILTNLKELPLAQGAIGKGVERGLKKSGLMIFRESQKEVPVDTGNLKGSSFTRKLEGLESPQRLELDIQPLMEFTYMKDWTLHMGASIIRNTQ